MLPTVLMANPRFIVNNTDDFQAILVHTLNTITHFFKAFDAVDHTVAAQSLLDLEVGLGPVSIGL